MNGSFVLGFALGLVFPVAVKALRLSLDSRKRLPR